MYSCELPFKLGLQDLNKNTGCPVLNYKSLFIISRSHAIFRLYFRFLKFAVYLRFKFNWLSYILPGKLNLRNDVEWF